MAEPEWMEKHRAALAQYAAAHGGASVELGIHDLDWVLLMLAGARLPIEGRIGPIRVSGELRLSLDPPAPSGGEREAG